MDFRREFDKAGNARFAPGITGRYLLGSDFFHGMIALEQRRAERSRKSLLLMLLEVNQLVVGKKETFAISEKIAAALLPIARETDVIGWYEENSVVGLIFTEINVEDLSPITTVIMNRICQKLKNQLSARQFKDINLSFHLLPEPQRRESIPISASSLTYAGLAIPSSAGESSF